MEIENGFLFKFHNSIKEFVTAHNAQVVLTVRKGRGSRHQWPDSVNCDKNYLSMVPYLVRCQDK